jgi:hypothetical protein
MKVFTDKLSAPVCNVGGGKLKTQPRQSCYFMAAQWNHSDDARTHSHAGDESAHSLTRRQELRLAKSRFQRDV